MAHQEAVTTMKINDTETASTHSISRAEIFTSRYAIQIEIAATKIANSAAEVRVARRVS